MGRLKVLLGLLPAAMSVWPLSAYAQLEQTQIKACRQLFSGVAGTEVYRCFDVAGNTVSESPVAGYLARSGWNPKQLDAYLTAYREPCAFRARLEELDSPLLILLWPELLSEPVCYNIDRSRVSFSHAGVAYLHQTEYTPGGGNARGAFWTLTATSGLPALLRHKQFPFLACERYRVGRTNAWQLELAQAGAHFSLKANNVSFPNRPAFSWQTEWQQLSERSRLEDGDCQRLLVRPESG